MEPKEMNLQMRDRKRQAVAMGQLR